MAEPRFFYQMLDATFTAVNVAAALHGLSDLLAEEGVAHQGGTAELELWTKAGKFMFGVAVDADDSYLRMHRSQMELDGWRRRA